MSTRRAHEFLALPRDKLPFCISTSPQCQFSRAHFHVWGPSGGHAIQGHARLSSDKVGTLLNTGVNNTGSSGSKAIITTQLLAVNLQAGFSLFQPHSETTIACAVGRTEADLASVTQGPSPSQPWPPTIDHRRSASTCAANLGQCALVTTNPWSGVELRGDKQAVCKSIDC